MAESIEYYLDNKKLQVSDFYHNEKGDVIWWLQSNDIGAWLFSFDKKKIYNMFADYPHNMTKEEVEIFDKENPYWADFFKDRKQ